MEPNVLLAQWLGSLVIAVTTAWVTVQLSLRRFRAEKVWERRMAAYVDVLAALRDMLRATDRWYTAEIEKREISEETEKELRNQFNEARKRFFSVAAVSALLLSKEANTLIKGVEDYFDSPPDAQNYFEHLDQMYGALKKPIDDLVAEGRKDLRL